MAKKKLDTPEALKPLNGRAKGYAKAAARDQGGPGASLEALLQLGNAYAQEKGYEPTLTAEDFKVVPRASRARGKEEPREPTLSEALAVRELAEKQEGGLPNVLAQLEAIDHLAEAAGGQEKLRACLGFWQQAGIKA